MSRARDTDIDGHQYVWPVVDRRVKSAIQSQVMVSEQTERRRREDSMSTAEFLADYEAKHGRKAVEVIARQLGADPPPRRKANNAHRPVVAGVKAKKRPALTPNFVAGSNIPKSVSWNEREQDRTVRLVKVRVVPTTGKARAWKCRACGLVLGDADHVQVSGRTGMQIERFHGACLPADARNGVQELTERTES